MSSKNYIYISTYNDNIDYQYNDINFKNYYKDFLDLGWTCINPANIPNNNLEQYLLENNLNPLVIYFCFVNSFIEANWSYIFKLNCIKCAFMDDLHQNSSRTRNFRFKLIKNFNFIFMTYAYCYNKFFPDVMTNKIKWIPHCVISSIKIEFNNTPIPKLLLSGLIQKDIYPMRQTLYDLRGKYAIDILEHPSYKYNKHEFIGSKFYKYLNQYLVCFTCCSNNNTPYLVQKFFEICYSGSLLLAYDKFIKSELERLGFIDGVNYISCSELNLEEKIQYILNPKNLNTINNIRKNGYLLVNNNHTSKNRAQLITHILDEHISTTNTTS